MTAEKLYKVLRDGNGTYSYNPWSLPKNGRPGKWMPKIEGDLIMCEKGYHLCRKQDLIHWIGPDIYEAGYKGKRIDGNNKIVVRQARIIRKIDNWNEQTARLFAADCAERVLHVFEEKNPDDNRPRKAIEAARAFARGEIDRGKMAAAGAAAWHDAAGAAAGDAAGDAAWGAERDWQTNRLFDYLEGRAK